jgi:GNAT superfamily N-acetyltransferase
VTKAEHLEVRLAEPGDLPSIIGVCAQALDWPDDGLNEAFFTWKHVDNPFGRSPIWLAEDASEGGRRLAGVRAMMRWELHRPGRQPMPVTRAVDTATLPRYQGRGIFTDLTMAAVAELEAGGVGAVFNTPNDKSRPGYLKMGWEQVGKVPVVVRPRSPRALVAMARSRTPADKWGLPTEAGMAAADAFADPEPIERALSEASWPDRWSTPLTVDYLRWRTSFDALECRVEPVGRSLADGFIVFRVRQRGALHQLSLLHVVSPNRPPVIRRVIARLLRATGADVAMASGSSLGLRAGMVVLPAAGPILTWRRLASDEMPSPADLDLPLGVVELF